MQLWQEKGEHLGGGVIMRGGGHMVPLSHAGEPLTVQKNSLESDPSAGRVTHFNFYYSQL